jgi:hypothetical protein
MVFAPAKRPTGLAAGVHASVFETERRNALRLLRPTAYITPCPLALSRRIVGEVT